MTNRSCINQIVFSVAVLPAFFACLSASLRFAHGDERRSFDLTVRLMDAGPNKFGGVSLPVADAFVYAPSIERSGRTNYLSKNKRKGFQDWLKKLAGSACGVLRTHQFSISDGQVVPQRVVGQTCDTWITPSNKKVSLYLQTVANSPVSMSSHTEITRKLPKVEPVPIPIKDFFGKADSGYALVLDHPLARVSNEEGFVEFENLPVGVDIPVFVSAPEHARFHLSSDSEALEISGSRFVIYSEDSQPRHVVLTLSTK